MIPERLARWVRQELVLKVILVHLVHKGPPGQDSTVAGPPGLPGSAGPPGPQGSPGVAGAQGNAATVDVGPTVTGAAGSNAQRG